MAIVDRIDTSEPDYFSRQVRASRRFFRSEAPMAEPNEYSVVSGGLETCVPSYEIKRNSFPYLAVEFVSSGHGSLTLNGRSYELTAGEPGYEDPFAFSRRFKTIMSDSPTTFAESHESRMAK